MIKISVSLVFLVAPVVLAQYGRGGYDYRAPQGNTQQENTQQGYTQQGNTQQGNTQQGYTQQGNTQLGYTQQGNTQQGNTQQENTQQGYTQQGYTQQGNTQLGYSGDAQDSLNRFLPSAGHHTEDYYRQHGPIQQQPQNNYQTYHTAQTGYHEVNFNTYSQNSAANLLSTQIKPQTASSGLSYNNARTPQPVITKHIYFHLPPPDDSATAAPVTAAPPKKIYNIIFIKLPSQKSANAARLQQLINQQAAEDKTLIYVLVKKPELQDLQAIQTTTSKPEVFFVKYKEPRSVALQMGGAGAATAGLGAGLRPGLVNGHGN